jgi:hypothetical protein
MPHILLLLNDGLEEVVQSLDHLDLHVISHIVTCWAIHPAWFSQVLEDKHRGKRWQGIKKGSLWEHSKD